MSKKSDGDVMSESYDVIAIFSIYSQFGAKKRYFFAKKNPEISKIKRALVLKGLF